MVMTNSVAKAKYLAAVLYMACVLLLYAPGVYEFILFGSPNWPVSCAGLCNAVLQASYWAQNLLIFVGLVSLVLLIRRNYLGLWLGMLFYLGTIAVSLPEILYILTGYGPVDSGSLTSIGWEWLSLVWPGAGFVLIAVLMKDGCLKSYSGDEAIHL